MKRTIVVTPVGGGWRERVLEAEAQNRLLHEQLAARDQTNASLCEYANRGWARVAVLDQELREADRTTPVIVPGPADEVGTLPIEVAAHLENLAREGMRIAADGKSDGLARTSRWLLRTLDEDAPVGDVIAAVMMTAWHWRGLEVRDQERFRRMWAEMWRNAIRARDDIPKKLGAMKRGRTKVDPAAVKARYQELVASGMAPKNAKALVARERGVSLATVNRYFQS